MGAPVDLEPRIRRIALANAIEHGEAPRPAAVLGRLLATDPSLRAEARTLGPVVDRVVEEVRRMSESDRQSALSGLGGDDRRPASEVGEATDLLPPLPGATPGRVVLRLAPFPSGALHIGNARMLFLNDTYRRRYRGKLLLVFDDTVGSEDKRIDSDIFDVIRRDLEIAETPVDAVYYKSDRIPLFYPWARRVIEKGAAYVCRCPADLLRENRRSGRACAHRSEDVAVTLGEWEAMLGGRYAAGEAVLRLRTDLADPDPAFRDRVLFRISDVDHPRVGRRYRVWPLLEFSWAVDDVELGITHVLRGKDLVIEDRMERYLWELLGVQGPPFIHWGILRVREAKISKSKAGQEVRSGEFDGWADPRAWSIQSLARRGIRTEALRRFTLSFGLSLADIEVPAETLYAENRQLIDPMTMRRSFVENPVRVDVAGYPVGRTTASLANHPDRPELGKRTVVAGPSFYLAGVDVERFKGTEVRLKDLVNVELGRKPTEAAGPIWTARFTSPENRRLPRIQWVGVPGAVPVDLLGLEGEHRKGFGEASLGGALPGEAFQFERVGFVRVESDFKPGTVPVRVCYGHP